MIFNKNNTFKLAFAGAFIFSVLSISVTLWLVIPQIHQNPVLCPPPPVFTSKNLLSRQALLGKPYPLLYSYNISYTLPITEPGGDGRLEIITTAVIKAAAEGGIEDKSFSFDISKRPVEIERALGVPRGFQDLEVRGYDASLFDLESLANYMVPTFLFNKSVIEVDSLGYLAFGFMFNGYITQYTFYHTEFPGKIESQQISLVREIRDKFELRKPWPEMIDASGPLCNHSADIVVVNDFENFANRYDSISAAVSALRCATGQILLLGMESRDKEHFVSVMSALPYHFEDVETLPPAASSSQKNPPKIWVAVHTQLFNRPALRIDIARGALDAPKLLSRLANKYPSLPFYSYDMSMFPPQCQSIREELPVILAKTWEDEFVKRNIVTCLFSYSGRNSIVKISSSDLAAREYYFLNKLYEADPDKANIYFPRASNPFIDEITGGSASCLNFIQGTTLEDFYYSHFAIEDVIQYAYDAVEILELLNRTGIVHRDVRDSNLMIRYTSDGSRRLALIDFMYSVSHDMPFYAYTPNPMNLFSYPHGYRAHCDIYAMADNFQKKFLSSSNLVLKFTDELMRQADGTNFCQLDTARLIEVVNDMKQEAYAIQEAQQQQNNQYQNNNQYNQGHPPGGDYHRKHQLQNNLYQEKQHQGNRYDEQNQQYNQEHSPDVPPESDNTQQTQEFPVSPN